MLSSVCRHVATQLISYHICYILCVHLCIPFYIGGFEIMFHDNTTQMVVFSYGRCLGTVTHKFSHRGIVSTSPALIQICWIYIWAIVSCRNTVQICRKIQRHCQMNYITLFCWDKKSIYRKLKLLTVLITQVGSLISSSIYFDIDLRERKKRPFN